LNVAIREALRNEIGLRLKRQDSTQPDGPENVGGEGPAVPIQLMEGLPAPLRELELTSTEAGALFIGQWRPALLRPSRSGFRSGSHPSVWYV
jgi:hypothetical protein